MAKCIECNIEFLTPNSTTTPLLRHISERHKEYTSQKTLRNNRFTVVNPCHQQQDHMKDIHSLHHQIPPASLLQESRNHHGKSCHHPQENSVTLMLLSQILIENIDA
ncbi:hypothetical protein niasHS_015684 [Heterodera schachtii]|uniref:BED-type domain-containing protein n=1 Tax=Heterodera schachtii TaxID=97005 RepID=A0ABD2HNU0_HETSC